MEFELKTFQGFYITLVIKDITLRFNENHYAFHHLEHSYPSSNMTDITTQG